MRRANAVMSDRAARQSSGTAASAACVGVEQQTAATSSISVRSVWCPTDAITGTRSSATVRHSASSQNANRSASEPPPRATMMTSTSGVAASSRSAAAIRGAAWRSWTGANAQISPPPQPPRPNPAETTSRALPRSARVPQLEIDARAGGPKAPHLAYELDASELLEALLELGGVGANRKRAREVAVRDALAVCLLSVGHRAAVEASGRSGPVRVPPL